MVHAGVPCCADQPAELPVWEGGLGQHGHNAGTFPGAQKQVQRQQQLCTRVLMPRAGVNVP